MAPAPNRYHHLDAVRAFAMLLGIVLHGMMSFICVPAWGAHDLYQNTPFYGTLLFAIHGFRLPLFFLISGFFTAMLWKKRGTRGLVKHRLKRIALPLLVFTIVIWPFLIAVSAWGLSIKMKRDAQGNYAPMQEIWQAAAHGDVAAIDAAVARGSRVDARDGLRTPALSYAAMHGQDTAIDHLLYLGADIHATNSQGMSALHFAALFGQIDAVKRLVANGAAPNLRNRRGQTPLEAGQTNPRTVKFIAAPFTVPFKTATFRTNQEAVIAFLRERTTAPALDAWMRAKAVCYKFAIEVPIFVHLWFLYYLLLILLLFRVAVALRKMLAFPIPGWVVATPTCFLWILPLTFTAQWFMTQGFGPDTAPGLMPWPPKLAYYTIFFMYGAIAFGRPVFEKDAGTHWKSLFLLAIPTLIGGIYFFKQEAHPNAHLYSSTLAVTYAWLMVFGMIGFFREKLSSPSPWIRYLSDASYWFYIAHIPLILVPQILLGESTLPHFLKFLLVCLFTFAALILSYAYFVRHTFIGTFLNGRKERIQN